MVDQKNQDITDKQEQRQNQTQDYNRFDSNNQDMEAAEQMTGANWPRVNFKSSSTSPGYIFVTGCTNTNNLNPT